MQSFIDLGTTLAIQAGTFFLIGSILGVALALYAIYWLIFRAGRTSAVKSHELTRVHATTGTPA
jgi:hypothetical protein